MEKDNGKDENTFKCYENLVVLYSKSGNFDKSIECHKKLLSLANSGKEFDNAIDHIIQSMNKLNNSDQQSAIYDLTLDSLKEGQKTIWISVALKIGYVYLESDKF